MVVGAVSSSEQMRVKKRPTRRPAERHVKMHARSPSFIVVVTAATAAAFSQPSLLKPLEKFQRVPPPQLSVSERGSPTPQGRIALAALAGLGLVETGAIAADKLSGSESLSTLCSANGGGCSDVLNGPWASVAGVPLALFGAAAYAAVALLAAAPLVSGDSEAADTSAPLLFGSAALATFSGCLMVLLLVVIQQPCALCFGSAAISAAIGLVAWNTPLVGDRTEAAVTAGSGSLMSLAAAAVLFTTVGPDIDYGAQAAYASDTPATQVIGRPPKITTRSSARALEIGKRLEAKGARFYGAYWCSHCANQKETLGSEAFKLVEYYECAPDGLNSRRDACKAAGIQGYPTWQVDGKLYPGERDLEELEAVLAGKATPQQLPE